MVALSSANFLADRLDRGHGGAPVMPHALVHEHLEDDVSRLVDDRGSNQGVDDGPHNPTEHLHAVPQQRHVGAREMAPLILTHYTVVSALGKGLTETYEALRNRRSGLRPCDFEDVGITTYIGRVADVQVVFVGGGSTSAELERFDCRNNRLALLGLQQDGFIQAAIEARGRYGAHRVAGDPGSANTGTL